MPDDTTILHQWGRIWGPSGDGIGWGLEDVTGNVLAVVMQSDADGRWAALADTCLGWATAYAGTRDQAVDTCEAMLGLVGQTLRPDGEKAPPARMTRYQAVKDLTCGRCGHEWTHREEYELGDIVDDVDTINWGSCPNCRCYKGHTCRGGVRVEVARP